MNKIKSVCKSACIAFSMFSSIPVPQFEWKEEDMRYMIVFFPFVGVVTGAALCLWKWVSDLLSVNPAAFLFIAAALPVLISGGIHVDGYMDTMDALHSWQGKEKKLEILKDSHIGAFSVIKLLLYYLLYLGACAQIGSFRAVVLWGLGFWLSRIISAISLISFPCAKKDGLLYTFATASHKAWVRIWLMLQLFVCAALLLDVSAGTGTLMLTGSGLTLLYYWKMTKKQFGGVTGDTSGYFTTVSEGVLAFAVAAGCLSGMV